MIELIANTVRVLSAEAIEKARSGHPGLPLGTAEIGALLFGEVLKHDPTQPQWPDRDRFVLSAGHGSMWLYALLHLTGYDLPLAELVNFRQLGSRTPGHPEYGRTPGVETTTGPLGQGLSTAVGMAIAERMLAARYNRPGHTIVDHRTYVLAGDGDMMEGITNEASSLAGHLGLGRLIVIYDCNRISIEGSTELAFTESVTGRYKALGWDVVEVDGYDVEGLRQALEYAQSQEERPHLIVAHTRIGKGSLKEDSAEAHGAPLGAEAVAALKQKLGWPEESFYVPAEVYEFFASRRQAWAAVRQNWEERFAAWQAAYPQEAKEWQEAMELQLPEDLEEALPHFTPGEMVSTRSSGGKVLAACAKKVHYLVGGSADLAPSTYTYLKGEGDVARGDFRGRNFHFGVREHAMAAILNGLSLHRGFRAFGSTFLVFADYMRPAIRLAALMGQPVIYVFTHDSIYVGEDGPTHQPVEQLESLRLIPNLEVIRPADAEESRQAWIEALRRTDGPTALVLTRQNLPVLPHPPEVVAEGVRRGGYLLQVLPAASTDRGPDHTASNSLTGNGNGGDDERKLTLVASGSEVALALAAAEKLASLGYHCRVVSMPCRERFLRQPTEYQRSVLPQSGRRVFIEAGVGSGWYRLARPGDQVISIESFGESGPAEAVARHFGFTPEAIVEKIRGY
ncbi:MAG: transketolase [Limnochordales bacterium]|nr:transketolase [Limnochordales bacterium]